ncbi:unnamed protein product [Penicillium discolor]
MSYQQPPHGYQQGPPQGYGYPPQEGYPPQGYPPQGYPPQGYPPQQQVSRDISNPRTLHTILIDV